MRGTLRQEPKRADLFHIADKLLVPLLSFRLLLLAGRVLTIPLRQKKRGSRRSPSIPRRHP
jgi:hypothetical protein